MRKFEKVGDEGFTPVFGRVLLNRPKEQKIGSIIIPEQAQSKLSPQKGKVVAVGENCESYIRDMIGETAIFAQYAGAWLKVGDQEYFICQEEDILGFEGNFQLVEAKNG